MVPPHTELSQSNTLQGLDSGIKWNFLFQMLVLPTLFKFLLNIIRVILNYKTYYSFYGWFPQKLSSFNEKNLNFQKLQFHIYF